MTITKTIDQDTLTVALAGRLDTITAPDLENALKSLTDVNHLVLDLQEVSYVSSAGLRVLLSLQKRMAQPKDMVVQNVQNTVMEVFSLAGFTDILTIA